jgi:hypothetical protein
VACEVVRRVRVGLAERDPDEQRAIERAVARLLRHQHRCDGDHGAIGGFLGEHSAMLATEEKP